LCFPVVDILSFTPVLVKPMTKRFAEQVAFEESKAYHSQGRFGFGAISGAIKSPVLAIAFVNEPEHKHPAEPYRDRCNSFNGPSTPASRLFESWA
jgi:hypothetical protein